MKQVKPLPVGLEPESASLCFLNECKLILTQTHFDSNNSVYNFYTK